MKGDFTRDTFDPANHFSRVLMQQGRVTLDADFNEQAAILLHYLRTLARDIIGPYAGPIERTGFALSYDEGIEAGLKIGAGRYYVDGILVENVADCYYQAQKNYPVPENDSLLEDIKNSGKVFWIYLDVWERHITSIEDDSIREKALGGPDTCTRAKVIWQVKALPDEWPQYEYDSVGACEKPLGQLVSTSKARLAARVDPGVKTEDACVTPPASKYRGAENQLYRVEIHQGGKVSGNAQPTFKWSRDDGSMATAWLGGEAGDLQLANARGFAAGNWVELSDDTLDLHGEPGTLVQIVRVEGSMLSVDPAAPARSEFPTNPKVRRWDQVETEARPLADDNAISVQEDVWINLEDGIQIRFSADGDYRSGDYWLIPARVATGSVEWPQAEDLNPQPLPPHGVKHHYAPLGFVRWDKASGNMDFKSCRCEFEPLSSCFGVGSVAVGAHLVSKGVGLSLRPAENARAAPAPRRARKPKRRTPSPP